MPNTASVWSTVAVLALSAAAASAQPANYTGPSEAPQSAGAQSGYSGPSSVPLMSVKQLLDAGRHNDLARVQGRIVSFNGDERYTFEDATGRMTVKIDAKTFPAGQTVSAEQRVELVGEIDKGMRKTELEVEHITLLP